jgi:hypothetical protein
LSNLNVISLLLSLQKWIVSSLYYVAKQLYILNINQRISKLPSILIWLDFVFSGHFTLIYKMQTWVKEICLYNKKRKESIFVFIFIVSGGTDILPWKDYGAENDIYITGLSLTVTDETSRTPVYYVSLKAMNGAGLESTPLVSTPIIVVDEDEPGKISCHSNTQIFILTRFNRLWKIRSDYRWYSIKIL